MSQYPINEIDHKSINTIRMLAVDAVEKANSGHPGLPLGAAPGEVLMREFDFTPEHVAVTATALVIA